MVSAIKTEAGPKSLPPECHGGVTDLIYLKASNLPSWQAAKE